MMCKVREHKILVRRGSRYINPLNTKCRLLYLRPSSYRAVSTFHLGYKKQSVYVVSGTSRCLFSDKYKTRKYRWAEHTIVEC